MASAPSVQIFAQSITRPAVRPRPLHYRVPFYKLVQHSRPVKWSLYRPLLRAAPSPSHARHVQQRWRIPSRRHQVSPSKTLDILKEEQHWLDTYRLAQDASGQTHAEAVQEAKSRIAAHDDLLALQDRREELERLALQQYGEGLKQTAARLQPVVTPSFIFPTLNNPPLPRLKPQPLHITMPIFKRRAARDRRIVREQSWKEMLLHAHQEQGFDASLGVSPDAKTEHFVKDTISDIRASTVHDFARLKLKFTKEMLEARNESRRKRPTILGHIRRKTETAGKLQDIYAKANERE